MAKKLNEIDEQVVLVNHTTGDTKHLTIRNVAEVNLLKQLQTSVNDGEYELQYIDGCLTGDACDAFLSLCELACEVDKDLFDLGVLFNVCDSLEDVKHVVDNRSYYFIYAKNEELAYREYLDRMGYLDELDDFIVDVINYMKWLNATNDSLHHIPHLEDEQGQNAYIVITDI